MQRRRVLAVAGGLVVLLALGLALSLGGGRFKLGGAKSADSAASAPTLTFRANEMVSPKRLALPQVVAFSGPLVAPRSAVIKAKTAGTLISLNVAEGDRVAAGQWLGQIDQAELGSRLAEREAQLAAGRAALAQAERTHAANKGLADQQFISANALDTSRAALDTARANLQALQATLATVQVASRDARLLAPIAGIVAKRHVLPGEKLSMEQPVLSIVNLQTLELAGNVGTHEVSKLRVGMPVSVQAEGLDQPLAATLSRIAPAAEPGTRAIGVTVALANTEERLRGGQYAMARVVLPDERLRLTVPLSAVGSASGQNHVWTLAGGRLQRRAITLGRSDEASGRVEVLTGLPDDALVLVARFDNLREGAKATILPLAADKAASSPGTPSMRGAPSTPASPASAANSR